MSELIVLCKATEVREGQPLAISAEGFPPLAVYVNEDKYFVTTNTCTHGMAMLSDGYQEGTEIECPFHGGAFDFTNGEAISFPCQIALTTYPVTILDGMVCIPAASIE